MTAGLAILTCSGGDSGIAADEAERLGAELPALSAATRERLAELLPDAATIGNPLDYTAMIWGDTDLLRRITITVGADPAIDQLLLLYDHPQGLAPEAAASWAAVRAGIIAGAAEAEAATLVASTLPDLIDDEASGELADRGVPAIAGLRTALACAQALRAGSATPGRLREIASAAAQATAAAPRPAVTDADGWIDEIDAKRLLRAAGIAVPEGRVVASEDECAAAVDELGGPVALKLASPRLRHKSDVDALRLDLGRPGPGQGGLPRALGLAGRATGRGSWSSEWRRRASSSWWRPAADAVVPALVIGLGGIWAEALDDVAVVPLPAERRARRGGDPLAAREPRRSRAGAATNRPTSGTPRRSPPRSARCCWSGASICSSSTRWSFTARLRGARRARAPGDERSAGCAFRHRVPPCPEDGRDGRVSGSLIL